MKNSKSMSVRLTQYSHGAGCGCKISPAVLKQILGFQSKEFSAYPNLLIGNHTHDDAAVYEIDNNKVIISTTDFFMPIVDDPFEFGAIASVNALSDVYAMGGTPLLAIAILGWPVDKIDPSIAGVVLKGARNICKKASIPLAGGHSIDASEPIFGLAVTGMTDKKNLKSNATATIGSNLYLTKPLGTGIITTAQKNGLLSEKDFKQVKRSMLTLNDLGIKLGKLDCVKAITDVTGFGLLGHLIEMCEGSKTSAEIYFKDIPVFDELDKYIELKTIPGGTKRNFNSYGNKVSILTEKQRAILCDPQTSGGLLIAAEKNDTELTALLKHERMDFTPIGSIISREKLTVRIL